MASVGRWAQVRVGRARSHIGGSLFLLLWNVKQEINEMIYFRIRKGIHLDLDTWAGPRPDPYSQTSADYMFKKW